MNRVTAMLAGAGAGALAMYILDPDAGRRRRALARDQAVRLQRKTRDAAGVTARDLRNRARGAVAESRRALFSDRAVRDDLLKERIRSKLGFLVRHPASIDVRADEGRVILSGPVLADECDQLIEGLKSVRGVRELENRLEVHEEPGSVPGLQGDKPKPTGEPPDLLQRRWSPSTRFLAGSAGLIVPFLIRRKFKRTVLSSFVLVALSALAAGFAEGNGDSRSSRYPGRRDRTTEPLGGWDRF